MLKACFSRRKKSSKKSLYQYEAPGFNQEDPAVMQDELLSAFKALALEVAIQTKDPMAEIDSEYLKKLIMMSLVLLGVDEPEGFFASLGREIDLDKKEIANTELNDYLDKIFNKVYEKKNPIFAQKLHRFLYKGGQNLGDKDLAHNKFINAVNSSKDEFTPGKAFKQTYKEFLGDLVDKKEELKGSLNIKEALKSEYHCPLYRLRVLYENFSYLDAYAYHMTILGGSGSGKTFNSTNTDALGQISDLAVKFPDNKLDSQGSKFVFRVDGGADREGSVVRKVLVDTFKSIYGSGAVFNLGKGIGFGDKSIKQPSFKGKKLKSEVSDFYLDLLELTKDNKQSPFVVHIVDVATKSSKKLKKFCKENSKVYLQFGIDSNNGIEQGQVRALEEGKKEGWRGPQWLAKFTAAKNSKLSSKNNVVMVVMRETPTGVEFCKYEKQDRKNFKKQYDELYQAWQAVGSPVGQEPKFYCEKISRAHWLKLEKKYNHNALKGQELLRAAKEHLKSQIKTLRSEIKNPIDIKLNKALKNNNTREAKCLEVINKCEKKIKKQIKKKISKSRNYKSLYF